MRKTINIFHNIMIILLIVLGIFLGHQITIKILGESWSTENIIIDLLIFNISFSFTITLTKLTLDNNHLAKQFSCLAKDFKEQKINNKKRIK